MNERIKELLKTVSRFDQDMDGSMEPSERGDWVQFDDLEKFAELIVKGCIDVLEHDTRDIHPRSHDYCVSLIKEHFGIK